MKLLKTHIINSEEIELREIIHELKEFKQEVLDSIKEGDRKFLPNISAKEIGAYKNPYSQQSVKAVTAWNILNPDNMIDLPSKVSLLKLNIFDEEDLEPLKETNKELYDLIMEKIFNDTTGLFVQKTWDPGIAVIGNKKDKEWFKKIPDKYRTKYKKLGIDAWNKFAEEHEDEYNGQWLYKKTGLQVLGVPSNASIPEWCQPFIDYSTIVNNIIAPFIPVLEIFQSKTIEEGRTRKGVNRKTKAFSNVVKF